MLKTEFGWSHQDKNRFLLHTSMSENRARGRVNFANDNFFLGCRRRVDDIE